MKTQYNLKNIIFFYVALIALSGCNAIHPEKDVEILTKTCDEEYYYYHYGEKILLRPSYSQIWIKFEKDTISRTEAENILEHYKFLHFNMVFRNNEVIAVLYEESDCEEWKNYLVKLNLDTNIFAATPVFYPKNSINNHFSIILRTEISLRLKDEVSHEDLIAITNNYGLEFITKSYGTYYFRVKNVVTGFESIQIANKLFENEKTVWATPNFLIPFVTMN